MTLYKSTTGEKILEWSIEPTNNGYKTQFCQRYGKVQEKYHIVKPNKQRPSTNDQISFEIASKIEKKKKEGYLEKNDSEAQSWTNCPTPMLAKKIEDYKKPIRLKEFSIQGKVDGIRCLIQINLSSKKITFYSRTKKVFHGFEHIREALINNSYIQNQNFDPEGRVVWLDGELYSHKLLTFQQINGLVKAPHRYKKEEQGLIKYVVYDILLTDEVYHNRLKEITKLCETDKTGSIELIPTYDINENLTDLENIENLKNSAIELGYEGLMLKFLNGMYEHKRTYNILKVKKFDDDEFIVTDVVQEDNDICTIKLKTDTNKFFSARPTGSVEERYGYLKNKDEIIGKYGTVKHQGFTDDGIPRFPIFKAIRIDK